MEGSKPKKGCKAYPIGYFHIDIAEVWTEEGKLYMLVAVDRTSKFAFADCMSGSPDASASRSHRWIGARRMAPSARP